MNKKELTRELCKQIDKNIKKNKYNDAIDNYKKIIALNPANLNKYLQEFGELYKKQNEKDKDLKFINCRNCRRKFTQTTHKGKKSLAICPTCGTHNK